MTAMAIEMNKAQNFSELMMQYKAYIAANKPDEARVIATWILDRYPGEAEKDAEIIKLIAGDVAKLQSLSHDRPKVLSR